MLVTIKEPTVAKTSSCWVGRHAWTTRVAQGESYTVCSKCGKTKTPPGVKKAMRRPSADYGGPADGGGGGGGDVGG